MSTHQLNVGIAGLGGIGRRRLELIERHENLRLTAVCDKSLADKKLNKRGVKEYSNLDDIFSEELDVLFVCLPNYLAPEVTISGLEKGWHVFCEKPPGRSPEDIARVREVEKCRQGLKLMYGFNHRHHDSVEDALNYMRSGKAGKLINLKGTYGKSRMANDASEWRINRSQSGGGILLDQGIHMVDLMRLFAGEFTDIHSFISDEFWNYDVEDNAYALMKSESGIIAFLHSSATQWKHTFQLCLTFESAKMELSGILSGSMSYAPETLTVINRENDSNSGMEIHRTYRNDNSWWKEVCIFTDAIINNRSIHSGSSLDALKTMELVYRIYRADQEWKSKYNL